MKTLFSALFFLFSGMFFFGTNFFVSTDNSKTQYVIMGDDYKEKWKKVDSLIKIGLPKSALKIVEEIYKSAKTKKNSDQVIKSFTYRLKLKNSIEENAFESLVQELEAEVKIAEFPNNRIMHTMLAEMYWMYYSANRWKFQNRTNTVNFKNDDMQTWTLDYLTSVTIKHYNMSLQDKEKLQNTPLNTYKEIINWGTKPKNLRPTLYDFLAHRAIDFYSNTEISLSKPADYFELIEDFYFADTKTFYKKKIETKDTLSLHFHGITILQDLLKFRSEKDDKAALIDADLKRLNYVYPLSVNPKKDSLYLNALQQMEKKFADKPSSSMISYYIANYYKTKSNKYSPLNKKTEKYKDYKKIAFDICEKTIEKYPKTEGADYCRSLKSQIDVHSLRFTNELYVSPNEKFAARIDYKSIDTIYVKVAELDVKTLEKLQDKYYGEELFDKIKNKAKDIYSESKIVPNDADFNAHSTEILLRPLKLGHYVIIMANNKEFTYKKNMVAYDFVNVTNITYIQQKQQNGSYQLYTLHRKTGQALAGVEVQTYYYNYNYALRKYKKSKGEKYISDKNGLVKVEAKKLKNYESVYFEFSYKDDFLSSNSSVYISKYDQKYYKTTSTYLFTDRAIYRPGQTVYFKGVTVSSQGDKKEIETKYKQTVTFYDPNYQKISDLKTTTNKFGTFSGSFTIPTGLLNGQMQIHTANGTKYIRVEEYKRPTFEVKMLPFKGNYRLDDSVTVKGLAKNYAGSKLTDADVKFRIQRQPIWRGWWSYYFNLQSVEIENGKIKTNDDGEFTIKFKAIPDLSIPASEFLVFNYTVSVDVTDLNGETQSTSKSIIVGSRAMKMNIELPDKINKNKPFNKEWKSQLYTQNLNGEFVKAKGVLKVIKLKSNKIIRRNRYWQEPDKKTYTLEQWDKEFPNNVYEDENNIKKLKIEKPVFIKEFDTEKSKEIELNELKKLKSGNYVLEMESKDAFGMPVSYKKFFTVFSDKDKKLPYPTYSWFTPIKTSCEPGDKAQFLIGAGAENTNLIYQIEHKGKILKTEYIKLNNEQKLIEIPVTEEHRGNFSVHFIYVKYNRIYKNSALIYVPYTNKMLDIEFETFRDKLYPGQDESWKLKIKGKNGDKVMAEMVATLYDASLDQFAANSFNFNIYNSYYTQRHWSGITFNTVNATTLKKGIDKYHYPKSYHYNSFNWFGFSYYRYDYFYGIEVEEEMVMMDAPSKGGIVRNKRKLSKKKNGEKAKPTMVSESKRKDKKEDGEITLQQKELSEEPTVEGGGKVQIRTNFNETAFFYPHLETNKEGEVIIKFKIPESLTRWKMLGFAHTKDLKYGFAFNELVTQKDLMVIPNAPRFFRENDEMEFPVKISNISKEDLTGEVTLEFLDATTMKPLRNIISKKDDAKKPFDVKSGKNTLVTWKLEIPEGVNAVAYKVIAKSEKFSDGEQKPLPVLTNRMLVTESLPLPIRSKETKTFEFTKLLKSGKSRTLKHHKLTLEFTSNPAWYAIQALPYLMEYPYECSEQTFSRFYANSIAAHIANSSPKVKAVFDSWKNTPDSKALLSNLEKNQELKALLLQETPWVLQGKDESERKRRVGLLFDLNRMANELSRAIRKLDKEQSSNGGWPWFAGMPESRYITQHIVTGMGHLDRLGVKNIREDRTVWNMLTKAVGYLDARIVEDYKWLKKHYNEKELKDDHLSQIAVHYLYGRSYFTDIEMSKKTTEAYEYYKGQAEKYWLKRGKYTQGMIALALHRYKSEKVPMMIINSLKEHSISHEELGMYWKDNVTGYFWYQAPIETQALMIEAFDEVAKDQESVDALKVWLLKQKQTQDWKTTKATVEACYALLLRGTDWLANDELCSIQMGDMKVDPKKLDDVKVEAGTGYFKTSWSGEEIDPKWGKVTVSKPDEGVSWGALYWQYFEQLDKITMHETPLKLKKQLFKEVITDRGKVIEPIDKKAKLKVGDKVIVRIELRVDREMEYVHMKDMRASGFEPINVISRYKWQDGLGYYESTKDASTNFFISYLRKGTYVFEYPLRVTHKGDFSNGITTIQCMYAPEFTSHSEGVRVTVE